MSERNIKKGMIIVGINELNLEFKSKPVARK
jgi:hypothetical protein